MQSTPNRTRTQQARTYTLGFSATTMAAHSMLPCPGPFKSRGNATYHAKKWAEPIHGSFGFMVLECKGDNAACPLWCTFRASGAQALLEPWHNTDGKEGENG